MLRKRVFWFAAAVAAQIVVLAGIAGFKEYSVRAGDEVLLRATVADPWDPFRGAFLALEYDIGELDPDELAGDDDFEPGQTIWVELTPGEDGVWEAVAIHHDRKRTVEGSVAMKGEVSYLGGVYYAPSSYNVRYGIEEVFISDATARDLSERPPEGNELTVRVVVDLWGRPIAREVLWEGRQFDVD